MAKIFYLGYLHFCDNFFPSSGFLAENQHFNNQPVNNLRIENSDEDIFTIDGEIFLIKKGEEIRVSFGPEISLVCPPY